MNEIQILFSGSRYKNKPTDGQISDAINCMRRGLYRNEPQELPLIEIMHNLDNGFICFPSGTTLKPEDLYYGIQVFFFDFDNTGDRYRSKKQVLEYLRKISFPPTFFYDTYHSTKEHNRFRLAYVMATVIKKYEDAETLKHKFWDILDSMGVDKQVKTTSGIIFGGTECCIVSDHLYREAEVSAVHARIVEKRRIREKEDAASMMLPTAAGFAYALNLVDSECYNNVKKTNATVLRLIQDHSAPADLMFDDNIADVDLSVLKAIYTFHCRNETQCVNEVKQEYRVTVAKLGRMMQRNYYGACAKTLELTLAVYNRLIAVLGENNIMHAFKNSLCDKEICYNGIYFNWLKNNLFDNITDIVPKECTHNIMIRANAYIGKSYGALLAEQLLLSLLRSGKPKHYYGISFETLINRTPQFKCKLSMLATVNEKNTYLNRAIKSMEKLINNYSSFPSQYDYWRFDIPDVSTKRLNGKIKIVEDTINHTTEDFFLRDMGLL